MQRLSEALSKKHREKVELQTELRDKNVDLQNKEVKIKKLEEEKQALIRSQVTPEGGLPEAKPWWRRSARGNALSAKKRPGCE